MVEFEFGPVFLQAERSPVARHLLAPGQSLYQWGNEPGLVPLRQASPSEGVMWMRQLTFGPLAEAASLRCWPKCGCAAGATERTHGCGHAPGTPHRAMDQRKLRGAGGTRGNPTISLSGATGWVAGSAPARRHERVEVVHPAENAPPPPPSTPRGSKSAPWRLGSMATPTSKRARWCPDPPPQIEPETKSLLAEHVVLRAERQPPRTPSKARPPQNSREEDAISDRQDWPAKRGSPGAS